MPEPRRHLPAAITGALDRDSQAEALLVDGLDRYVEGRYEEAIHVWTRVLFLDRSHARARAYIDRARTALAERQRQADEMLHATGESIAQGDAGRARQLLSEAVQAAGDDERAAGLRLHLERLERVQIAPHVRPAHPPAVVDAVPVRRPGRARTHAWLMTGVASLGVLGLLIVSSGPLRDWLVLRRATPTLATRGVRGPAAVPTASEVAFVRARTLFTRGRLAEALRALDRVVPDSEYRPAADALRVRIQELLLASGRSPASVPSTAGRP
jgi:tetratricopeptide (TPR) repeat protein